MISEEVRAEINLNYYRLGISDLLDKYGIGSENVPMYLYSTPTFDTKGYLRYQRDDKGNVIWENGDAKVEHVPWPDIVGRARNQFLRLQESYFHWLERYERAQAINYREVEDDKLN